MTGVARMDGRDEPGGAHGDRGRADRGHTIVPHTADAGLRVVAPSLAALFEEAASALSAFTADLGTGARSSVWEEVRLEAQDLPGLAYAWLNELVALGDIHHGAVIEATAVRVDRPDRLRLLDRRTATGPDRMWSLHARIGLTPYATGGPRPRRQVKSATFHRLDVRRRRRGWTLLAYLDV